MCSVCTYVIKASVYLLNVVRTFFKPKVDLKQSLLSLQGRGMVCIRYTLPITHLLDYTSYVVVVA